ERREESDRLAAVVGERLELCGAQRSREQGVVAELGVGVEREVVGGERDAGLEQDLQAALEWRVDRGDARAPEESGVDDQQLRLLRGRPLEQLRACGEAAGERGYALSTAGDLQAVQAEILEAGRLEQALGLGEDISERGRHRTTIAARRRV